MLPVSKNFADPVNMAYLPWRLVFHGYSKFIFIYNVCVVSGGGGGGGGQGYVPPTFNPTFLFSI